MKSLALIFLLTVSAAAQSGAVQEKPTQTIRIVTVNIRHSEPVKGRLIRADSELVVIENGISEIRVKTDNVISIDFRESEPPPGVVAAAESKEPKEQLSKQSVAAQKIVSALRRMENAAAVGVTLQNYSAIMIESKTIVDESLKDLADDSLALSIQQILDDHQYALSVWNLAAANGWAFFKTKMEPGRTLVTRYGFPMKISIWNDIPVMSGVNYIWLSARSRFNKLNAKIKAICSSC